MEIIFKISKNLKEIKQSYSLISNHYQKQDLNQSKFDEIIKEMISRNNYQMLMVFVKEKAEKKLIAVCGFWIARMFYCGRYLQISNLIVSEKYRSNGVGKKVLQYIENIALKHDCQKVVLDSYTENKKSHSLYFKEGFYIRGFHFMKDVGGDN